MQNGKLSDGVCYFQSTGGHTKEMLTLLTGLSNCYYPRIYVMANTDSMSEDKIRNFEKENEVQIKTLFSDCWKFFIPIFKI